ncbi:MAG: hypothetical protein JHC33_12510 [Ignisphaera sp.]|jgi:hypothetical protein|nr:hypothetical protein [Ignisphaera sp.]
MKITKKKIVIKMEFDLVDWLDDTTVPAFAEVASTLKIISMYNQSPEAFNKRQVKDITRWLNKNSVEKFVNAQKQAERHQALLKAEGQLAAEFMWTKRINTDH